jgi:hypothetical protein
MDRPRLFEFVGDGLAMLVLEVSSLVSRRFEGGRAAGVIATQFRFSGTDLASMAVQAFDLLEEGDGALVASEAVVCVFAGIVDDAVHVELTIDERWHWRGPFALGTRRERAALVSWEGGQPV